LTKNIDPIFSGVLKAGLIKIEQLYEKGLGLDDILDLNEILLVANENEFRAYNAARNQDK